MIEKHILSQFDNDLEEIQAHILKMGGLVEMAISDSMKAFVHKDLELAQNVRSADAAIDNLEELINEEAARVIALRAPTAVDLRVILSVIKVSANLERIGDYAKNVAKRTGVLIQMNEIEDAANALRRLAREVELMLKDALDARRSDDGGTVRGRGERTRRTTYPARATGQEKGLAAVRLWRCPAVWFRDLARAGRTHVSAPANSQAG